MRRANVSYVLIVVVIALAALTAAAAARAPKEYYTDEEVDYIRDAQGLTLRIPAVLRLANIRLVALGMKEKSKDDRELEKRISEIHIELLGKSPTAADKSKPQPKVAAEPYLTDFTRTELLRGYIEALDEVAKDIDDAYRQKLEIRGVLEQFEKFCSAAALSLRTFQSHSAAELQAIDDARSVTQEALDNAHDAMKKIPKTEKSVRP